MWGGPESLAPPQARRPTIGRDNQLKAWPDFATPDPPKRVSPRIALERQLLWAAWGGRHPSGDRLPRAGFKGISPAATAGKAPYCRKRATPAPALNFWDPATRNSNFLNPVLCTEIGYTDSIKGLNPKRWTEKQFWTLYFTNNWNHTLRRIFVTHWILLLNSATNVNFIKHRNVLIYWCRVCVSVEVHLLFPGAFGAFN